MSMRRASSLAFLCRENNQGDPTKPRGTERIRDGRGWFACGLREGMIAPRGFNFFQKQSDRPINGNGKNGAKAWLRVEKLQGRKIKLQTFDFSHAPFQCHTFWVNVDMQGDITLAP